MKKTMYLLGYLSAFLLSTGLVFKFQQWPGASIMLVTGTILLNLGFIPALLVHKFKRP